MMSFSDWPGNDVVERDQPLGQLAHHEDQLLFGVGDHAEAQLVVDVGRDRLLLGQQLRDQAVGVLAAPLELDHRAADRLDLLDGAQHLLLDQVEDLVVGDGQLGQQLAPRQVMHDVHDLEHDARVGAPPPLLRSDQQQVARRHAVRDLVRDLKAEVPFEVLDRRLAQLAQPTHVVLVGGIHLVDAQEPVDLLAVGEIQPVPVDDRAPAQQVADRGQIAEREVFVAQPAPLALAGRHPPARPAWGSWALRCRWWARLRGRRPRVRAVVRSRQSRSAPPPRLPQIVRTDGVGAKLTASQRHGDDEQERCKRAHYQAPDDRNHTFVYIGLQSTRSSCQRNRRVQVGSRS